MSWQARVLLHVDDVAVIQLPGGTLAVRDPESLLQDGDNVLITASDGPPAAAAALQPYILGPYRVRRNGQAALLLDSTGMYPLLLRADESLPAQVYLKIHTAAAEQDEGVTPTPPVQDLNPPDCGCSRMRIPLIEVLFGYQAQCRQEASTP